MNRINHSSLFFLLAILLPMLLSVACEVNRSGSDTWQKLPDLSKPKLSLTTDMGGEFRNALEELENVSLEENENIITVSTFRDIAYFAGGLDANVAE